MPIPDTLKGIDDLIHAGFEAYRSSCFNWLLGATGVVVVGLVLEGPELWHEITSIIGHWRFNRRFHFSLPETPVPNWAKLAAFVGWLFIVVGVAGEYFADSFVSKADGYVQTFDEILLTEAKKESAHAEATAKGFDAQIAESNAKARSAEATAKQFEAQISDANARAAQAELELARIKAPRSLTRIPKLIASLIGFSGTEYEFSGMCQDEECANLLRVIDNVLQKAGWKRVIAPHRFPSLNVSIGDKRIEVPATMQVGFRVEVDSPNPNIESIPFEKLPPLLKAAVALNIGLFDDVYPPQEGDKRMQVSTGDSQTVRISLGRKQ